MKKGYERAGITACGMHPPENSTRVFFRRAKSGSPTIYLYRVKEHANDAITYGASESSYSFGWVPGEYAKTINLQQTEGWRNYYKGSDTVVFTDNIGPASQEHSIGQTMGLAELHTDFVRQSRDWRSDTPPDSGQQPPAARAAESKENQMAYAPQSAKALGFSASGVVASLVNNNKDGLQAAAYLEAGRIANNQLTKLASKSLPMMVRGYADTPVGKIVVANLAQQIIMQFRPQEPKLVKLSQAMVTEAMQALIQTVDIEAFIDQLVGSADGQRALSKLPD